MTEGNEERELEPFRRHGTDEDQVELSADEVLNAIAEGREIDIEWAVIEGDLDIKKIRDDLAKEDGRSLIRCNVKIQRSTIKGETNFGQARFCGDVEFRLATFSKNATFSGATFSGGAVFSYATFSGNATFSGATFGERANFRVATFGERANFYGATFSGGTSFERATFSGYASFYGATFGRDAHFPEATFSGYADFMQAHMEHPANFAGVCFKENTVFVGLWNNVFRLILWLISYLILQFAWKIGLRLILRPNWCHGSWLVLRSTLWLLNSEKLKLPEKKPEDIDFLRRLRENGEKEKAHLPKWPVTDFQGFNTATVMDGSSNPYLKRYIDDKQWIVSWRQRGWLQKFWFFVWELTSHCGRSIGLWAFWSLCIALSFGRLYAGHPEWFEQSMGPLSPWYFSVVTFTTLGFGDLTPKPECWQGQCWVMAEVILGYIMLGGLISIFANKLARRA